MKNAVKTIILTTINNRSIYILHCIVFMTLYYTHIDNTLISHPRATSLLLSSPYFTLYIRDARFSACSTEHL